MLELKCKDGQAVLVVTKWIEGKAEYHFGCQIAGRKALGLRCSEPVG